jgi:DNA-binding NtrC family response regulator
VIASPFVSLPDEIETNVLRRAPSSLAIASLSLVVLDGPDRGARFKLGEMTRIGTAEGNEVRLADRAVSRLHATVRARPDGVTVRDEGSTNGTFIDGVRVRDADLAPGATLKVGATTLRAEVSGESVFIELSDRTSLGDIVGESAAMRRIYAMIERVAPTDSTVLIQGETGTGKELVARAIHERSRRAGGPFVAIDCGAIPDNLVESELFGHVRGAFSGAVQDRMGVFEEADGGTLFFDEIGEIPLALQRKLLRALETREIRRVGSNRDRKVDVRVLAATHRPLAQAVNEGLFREDLFYRLAVVTLELPPLRARREDIPRIAQHFLDRLTNKTERLSPALASTLVTRGWPGNVRELRNYLERRVALGVLREGEGEGEAAGPSRANEPLPAAALTLIQTDRSFMEARDAWIARFEDAYVRAILQKTGGNVTRAAELAKVSRRFLQRAMMRLGLRDAEPGREGEE